VPSGATGQPGGDAAFSITAGADIFGLDKKLEIYDKDLNKIGDLFARESFQSLRTHISQQSDLKINWWDLSNASPSQPAATYTRVRSRLMHHRAFHTMHCLTLKKKKTVTPPARSWVLRGASRPRTSGT
jgi:hypothetical protein